MSSHARAIRGLLHHRFHVTLARSLVLRFFFPTEFGGEDRLKLPHVTETGVTCYLFRSMFQCKNGLTVQALFRTDPCEEEVPSIARFVCYI